MWVIGPFWRFLVNVCELLWNHPMYRMFLSLCSVLGLCRPDESYIHEIIIFVSVLRGFRPRPPFLRADAVYVFWLISVEIWLAMTLGQVPLVQLVAMLGSCVRCSAALLPSSPFSRKKSRETMR